MTAVLVGLALVAVGLLLCLRGAVVLRVLITVWAALVGFLLGGSVVAASTGDTFLAGVLGVVVAVAVGLLLGAAAYVFYALAILVAMAAFGFALGTSLMVAVGVSWSWLVVTGGVVVGLALGALAVVGNLPMVVLVVLSALVGASTAVTGGMLVLGVVELEDLTVATTTEQLDDRWWWYAAYLALAGLGAVLQLRLVDRWTAPAQTRWDRGGTHRDGAVPGTA